MLQITIIAVACTCLLKNKMEKKLTLEKDGTLVLTCTDIIPAVLRGSKIEKY